MAKRIIYKRKRKNGEVWIQGIKMLKESKVKSLSSFFCYKIITKLLQKYVILNFEIKK